MSRDPPPTSSSASAKQLHVGDVVDERYRIDAVHASGGMGTIYRATHLLLERAVALKVVLPELIGLPGAVERFLLEARATTLIKNDHVVQMFDVGILANGAPYLVMEWLEGQDLSNVIAKTGKIPVETAITYILQTCEALAEAHGCGIVHRDLKPSNLFLTKAPDGTPRLKLLDFGVSKVMFKEQRPRITRSGSVVGSPSYMSPEQMGQAAFVDARSDVWGLGVVLFELLTKQLPFSGENLSDILAAILLSPLPVASEIRNDIPEEIDAVLSKCLQYDANDRFADVAELAAAIAPFGPRGSERYAQSIARLAAAAHTRDANQGVSEVVQVLGAQPRSSVAQIEVALTATRVQTKPEMPRKRRVRARAALVAVAIVFTAVSVPAVTHAPWMFRSQAQLSAIQPTPANLPASSAPALSASPSAAPSAAPSAEAKVAPPSPTLWADLPTSATALAPVAPLVKSATYQPPRPDRPLANRVTIERRTSPPPTSTTVHLTVPVPVPVPADAASATNDDDPFSERK